MLCLLTLHICEPHGRHLGGWNLIVASGGRTDSLVLKEALVLQVSNKEYRWGDVF